MTSKLVRLLHNAVACIGTENYSEASAILESLLENQMDKNIEEIVFEQLSVCYIHLKKWREAAFYLEKLILNPSTPNVEEIYKMLTDVYEDLSEYKKAIETYKKFAKNFIVPEALRVNLLNYYYKIWRLKNEPNHEELEAQRNGTFLYNPKISIVVPVYNTKFEIFIQLFTSVIKQTYGNWELCLADGNSKDENTREIIKFYASQHENIKYIFLDENKGIAENTNCAIDLATGEYIAFLDHDDMITENALYEIVKEINYSDPDLIYTDSDFLWKDTSSRLSPVFKPDWSPTTFRSFNYIVHFVIVKKEILNKVGRLSSEYDGCQDTELIFKVEEVSKKIAHIPKVLYNWRYFEGSVAESLTAKPFAANNYFKLLESQLQKENNNVTVDCKLKKVVYHISGVPKISIIVVNQDNADGIRKAMNFIVYHTVYVNYEIIMVDKNTTDIDTLNYYEVLKKSSKIKFVKYEKSINNLSQIYNDVAKECDSEFLVFLSSATEIIDPMWLNHLLVIAQQKNVGVVGAMVSYLNENEPVMKSGIEIVGSNFDLKKYYGYNRFIPNNFQNISNFSAVSNVCFIIKKELFDQVGGFDCHFPIAFNSIDLCQSILQSRYHIVLNTLCEVHYWEKKSLFYNEGVVNLEKEVDQFENKWGRVLKKPDPFVSPYWSFEKGDCPYNLGLDLVMKNEC